jgi:hypothetical protein
MLSDAAMIQHVFSFLPTGNWLFLGAVCRKWQAVYADQPDQQVFSIDVKTKLASCCSNITLYSAAVASPAIARLAHSCGLAMSKNNKLQSIAGRYADLATLAALHELGMPLSYYVFAAVAESGRLTVLQHLVIQWGRELCTGLSYYAARSGNISMLEWLRTQEKWYEIDEWNACSAAAEAGHLAVQQHLINEGWEWYQQSTVYGAACSGSIELVEWLRLEQDVETDDETLLAAASTGQIDLCEHLLSIGCVLDSRAHSDAARNGHIDTLRWLRKRGCLWIVSEVCMNAARYGSTDILEYILEQGEVLDAELLTDALNDTGAFNRLAVVQWLRQHGAAWPAALGSGQRYFHQWSGDTLAWLEHEAVLHL